MLYCLAAAAVLLLAYLTRTETLTDWDSWDYASLAHRMQPSGLCSGRWWFILFMRGAYQVGRWAGVDVLYNFIPMKIAVALMTAGAVVVLMHWTYRLTGRPTAAALAGLMAICSPTLVIYSSAVMTEGPTLLLLGLAMLGWDWAIAARPSGSTAGSPQSGRIKAPLRAALAGMAFGIAANMREPAIALCCWPVVSCFIDRPQRRWLLLAAAAGGAILTLGYGVASAALWRDNGLGFLEVFRQYQEYMTIEVARRGFDGWMNVSYLLLHFLLAAPLAAVFIVVGAIWLPIARTIATPRGDEPTATPPLGDKPSAQPLPARRLAWMAASTIPFILFTWYNPDLSFNYRLLLPLGWVVIPAAAALALATADDLRRRTMAWQPMHNRAIAAVLIVCVYLVASLGYRHLVRYHLESAAYQSYLFDELRKLPNNAAIVPGPGSSTAAYVRDVQGRSHWRVNGTDSLWTCDSLTAWATLNMRRGRGVFVNLNPTGWTSQGDNNPEWKAVRGMVSKFDQRPAGGPFYQLLPRGSTPATMQAPLTARDVSLTSEQP